MATDIFAIEATTREDMGKGASRRLRRMGDMVPAIVYGGKNKPEHLSLHHRHVVKALENEAFYSHILTLKVNGKAEKVVLKDLQRHPYKPRIMHMDFQRVSATQMLTMHVPLHFMGEDVAPGVKAGGKVSHTLTEIEVRCLPKDLPEFIELDLSQAELDAIIHLSDLKLPKGVEIVALAHGSDQPVASIHLPKRGSVEDEASAAESTSASASEDQSSKKEDK